MLTFCITNCIYIVMDPASIYTVIITILTVFGSASAWRFYEKRMSAKEKIENLMKDDSRDRISKLEILLEKSSKEKEQMRQEILELTSQVSELRVKVEFLEKENKELMDIKKLQQQQTAAKRTYKRKPKKN